MVRTISRRSLCLALLACQCLPSLASDRGTSDEAVAMVKKAITHLKANGLDKTVTEVSNPQGQFVNGDLYVVIDDLAGTVLAHGTNPRLIGKVTIDMKDADGKLFVREMVETAKSKGHGWVDYRWLNPSTKQIESKSAYLERVGDVFVLCGIYKH